MNSKYCGYKRSHLIGELKRFYREYSRIPNPTDFDKLDGYPNRKTFTNHFESFWEALRMAGFDVPDPIKHSKESLIPEIHRFYKENGRVPLSRDMKKSNGYIDASNFRKLFGSWGKAIEVAGFKAKVTHYSDEDLKTHFMRFYEINGRPPKLKEFNTNPDYPSFWCYQNRFGSWNKTLLHYGFEVNEGTAGSHHEFSNGEVCKSHFEFDVSTYLRKHGISYLRNVLYHEWIEVYEGKKDCDYVILHNGEFVWLEIAGLYPYRDHVSSMERDYKKRFDHKLDTLLKEFNYKVLYPQDFKGKTLDEMFSFLFEIKRPTWLTYEEVYSGNPDQYEIRVC
ncbi:hypothetical protein MKY95_19640 [Paenibacillus sp. FSL P4-0176]|uniref:homing endonuclease associated repeat-containing protein n=1 Tax=Paenibacillus sp. FSL P4-0176 TaxID=2921631 RepID=UPI0030CB542B